MTRTRRRAPPLWSAASEASENAFDATGVLLLAEHDRHPSLLRYVEQGHEIIAFSRSRG